MTQYDLSSPFMAARIITKSGEQLPLWTGGGAKSDQNLEKFGIDTKITSALSFVQDITIERQLNQVSKITVVLTPPFQAARALLDSDFMSWGGDSFIEVQFGYTGGAPNGPVLSTPYSALILKPDIQIGQDTTLTINAQGAAFRLAAQRGDVTGTGTREALMVALVKRNDILSKSASAITQVIVDSAAAKAAGGGDDEKARRDLKIQVIIDKATRADALAGKALAEVVTEAQGHLTDKQFLEKLAHEAHCDIVFLGNVIKIKSKNAAIESKPKYTLRLFEFPNGVLVPGFGTFPILSVSSSSVFQFLSGATRGMVRTSVESEERTKDKGPVKVQEKNAGTSTCGSNDKDANVAPPEDSKAYPKEGATGRGLAAIVADPAFKKTSDQQMRAAYAEVKDNNGVRLEIETFAIPDVEPNDTVQVVGLGKRFDGCYRILKLTHTLGSAGSSTMLEVIGGLAALPGGIGPIKKNKLAADKAGEAAAADKVKANPGSAA